MEAISLGMLKVSGEIDLESVLEYSSSEEVCERTIVKISGKLSKEQAEKLQKKQLTGGKIVTEYLLDAQYYPLFFGRIEKVLFDSSNNQIQMECSGLERLIDTIKKSRSFQNTKLSFMDVIKKVISENGSIKCHDDNPCTLKTPVIQFEETDWEFIRRMAGNMNTIMYTKSASPNLTLFFGTQKQKTKELNHIFKESMVMDRKQYLKSTRRYSREVYISAEILSYEYFELGDKLHYQKKNLVCNE